MKPFLGIAVGLLLGGVLGYAGKCVTGGACPITCNPYISALLGGIMGFMFTTTLKLN